MADLRLPAILFGIALTGFAFGMAVDVSPLTGMLLLLAAIAGALLGVWYLRLRH
jgi:hypothetical protein